jgi:hypothetical protein
MNCKSCQAPSDGNSLVCSYCGSLLGSVATPAEELQAVDELLLQIQREGLSRAKEKKGFASIIISRMMRKSAFGEENSSGGPVGLLIMSMWVPRTPDAVLRLAAALVGLGSDKIFDPTSMALRDIARDRAESMLRIAMLESASDARLSRLHTELQQAKRTSRNSRLMKRAVTFGGPSVVSVFYLVITTIQVRAQTEAIRPLFEMQLRQRDESRDASSDGGISSDAEVTYRRASTASAPPPGLATLIAAIGGGWQAASVRPDDSSHSWVRREARDFQIIFRPDNEAGTTGTVVKVAGSGCGVFYNMNTGRDYRYAMSNYVGSQFSISLLGVAHLGRLEIGQNRLRVLPVREAMNVFASCEMQLRRIPETVDSPAPTAVVPQPASQPAPPSAPQVPAATRSARRPTILRNVRPAFGSSTDGQLQRPSPTQSAPSLCTNTCRSARDEECDDGGPGSDFAECAYGTDCADCGPRRPR